LGVMYAPRTYTREDIVEINAHSGAVVLQAILELLLTKGARLAEPGEFTKRAFLNGRIDLTQAEAVIDIITAKTDKSLEIAGVQLSGVLRNTISDIRGILMQVLAETEAAIDFPEEMERALPAASAGDTIRNDVIVPLGHLIDRYEDGHFFRDGVRMIIVGRPNVGKSSLMNRLIEQDRVIVTAIPGTTRDVIEETVNIGGIPVTIADSAGLHESTDPVEAIGVEKTWSQLMTSDLVLMMIDVVCGFTDADRDILDRVKHKEPILVINKMDLLDETETSRLDLPDGLNVSASIQISALYDNGIDELKETIEKAILGGRAAEKEFSVIPGMRHKIAMEKARGAAIAATGAMGKASPQYELAAIDLHEAVKCLGEIVGENVAPDILDEIFSRFCIGK